MLGAEIDWKHVRHVRDRIAKLEAELERLYAERKELIVQMKGDGMSYRPIASYWGISEPRITQITTGRRSRR